MAVGIENTASATAPLRCLEVAGTGQTFSASSALQLVTCLTTVNRNTLLTSTWSGSAFTCGSTEAGLWSFFAFLELTNPVGAINVVAVRTRSIGGAQEYYWPTGTTVQQPGLTVLMDLAAGDTVQIYLQTTNVSQQIVSQPIGGAYSSLIAYRITGLH
jgi:hypothetical protein